MYSVDLSSSGPGNSSVPASPITTSFIRQGVSQLRALTQRSTSMDWVGAGNRTGHDGLPPVGPIREGSLGPIHAGGGNRGSALSLAFGPNMGSNASLHQASNRRLGRSVSPECTMKKLNNYPDAPPGFFIHTSSRQGSTDSLSSLDYSQRSFTLPGKPHFRSAVSPARKKFFEDSSYSSANYTLKLNPRNGSKHHPQSPPSIDNLSGSSGKATQQATPSINQESGDQSKSARSTAEDGSKRSSGKSERERRSDRSTPSRFFARFTSHSGKSSRKTSPKPGGGGDDSAKSKEQDMGKKLVDALGKRLSSSSNKKADDAKVRGKSGTRQSPASNLASSKSKSIDLASGSGTNKEGEPKHLTGVSKTNEAKRSIEPPSSSSMFGSKMKRSGSVNNISPAIMALRQKFSGGVGSSK